VVTPEARVGRYVFLSYVREDEARVDRLQLDLQRAGFRVWRDLQDLLPGQDWRAELRAAVTTRDIVVVPCYSISTVTKPSSVMHQEVDWAAAEHRRRRPDRPWIFPVLLDDVPVPVVDLGGGRTLADIQHAALYRDRDRMTAVLVDTLARRLDGRPAVPLRADSHALTDILTGLFGDFLTVRPQVPVEPLLDAARALWPAYRHMRAAGWSPATLLVRHPEWTPGRLTVMGKLVTGRRHPTPPPLCWDVELTVERRAGDRTIGELRELRELRELLDVVDPGERTDAEVLRRCTPSVPTLMTRRTREANVPLVVRPSPGRPLRAGPVHVLTFRPAHQVSEPHKDMADPYGSWEWKIRDVPERFEPGELREVALPDLLRMLRPTLTARDLPAA
jgi:hypothetical protein